MSHSATIAAPTAHQVPVLLLKTKSTPTDGYEDYLSAAGDGRFHPVFVPVLEHRFRDDSLLQLRTDVRDGRFGADAAKAAYGAIIFTSQRAVEAFTMVVEELRRGGEDCPLDERLPASLPLYVVGPATARGLGALGLPCPILGEESGNGDALAQFILEHYNSLPRPAGAKKLPILFLVGEQRRDIIPKTLQSPDLPDERRSEVHEVVVYETGEMQSFRSDFAAVLAEHEKAGVQQQWVVVFSPTGCKAMLESLRMVDESTGKVKKDTAGHGKRTFVATIGPTTRDYLLRTFEYEPDVCAKKPSPEGVGNGIEAFMQRQGAGVPDN